MLVDVRFLLLIRIRLESTAADPHLLPTSEKKNIKLIPINPAVCFATTTSASVRDNPDLPVSPNNSSGPVFVPVIDISGKKYLPVYLKPTEETNEKMNEKNSSDKIPARPSNRTPTIVEENENETQTNSSAAEGSKTNVYVERLSMAQVDQFATRHELSSTQEHHIKDNGIGHHKSAIKVPSHIFMRRSPESQKNLRAKTVRIGKIRWPPPLNPEDADNANQQRRMLVQRRIQEEIHGGKSVVQEKRPPNRVEENLIEHPFTPQDRLSPSPGRKSIPIESRVSNSHRLQIEERVASSNGSDACKRVSNSSAELPPPLSDDDEMSTTEIVARNQQKLDFHQTLTPMIGKENFELRKKLFENGEDPSALPEATPPLTDPVPNSKPKSRQSHHFLTYHQTPWKIKVRKEVFSPMESYDQPLLMELLYLQILHDTFSPMCIRISENERNQMKTFLASRGVVTLDDIGFISQSSAKKTIIEQARQWPTYFCRFFPVSMPKYLSDEVQMLGISHSAVRLLKRTRGKGTNDTLQVLETVPFDLIQQVSIIRAGTTLDLRLTKKHLTIHSHRTQKIKQLMDKFLKEARQEPSRKSRTPNQEKFKGSRETLSPHLNSNTSDLLKSSSQASLISCSQTFSELIPSVSLEIHTPKPTRNDMTSPSISGLPNGHSMMEFALQNFHVPNRRRSKKGWKTSEWTWQDYADLLRWSKTPIQSPLLRHSSNDISRLARQCFVAIMRFMGDHAMSRGQSDIDCVCFLLKNMHKHRALVDEIVCQLMKQITENKSTKHESAQRGWKLLLIILNYFIPSEHLRPYFVKYLNDHHNQHEKLVQSCLKHYEQTLKYGGRKNTPSKAEVDLLTANGRNGGKRQTFLLPGGNPVTLLATPSMVINDCLNQICERVNIPHGLEYDEYSIFLISGTEQSARLLDPTEYLFDVLSECVRSHIPDYHLIVKRMLWFNLPIIHDPASSKADLFIDFMYHQLVPELLEGTMIVIKNNYLSDEMMHHISLLAALQYHAGNKIGLPSMREVKHLLPMTVLQLKSVRPQVWTTTVHEKLYSTVEAMSTMEAKIQFLNILQNWPLFGMTFFAAQSVDDLTIRSPCLIGINKNGILFLDIDTRETLFTILYHDVVSIRRHQNAIDIKYGSLSQPHVLQCQVDRAQDFVALAGRYLSLVGRSLSSRIDRPLTSVYNDPISTML